MEKKTEALLEIYDLSVSFRMYDHRFSQTCLQVISNLYLTVHPGEIVAVAGSSGSGKSLLASAILGILPKNATIGGRILYQGEELTQQAKEKLRKTEIAYVPQSVAYLDPLMRAGAQAEGYRKIKPKSRREQVFRRLGLKEDTKRLYPFQLSGGMARRVLVAAALCTDASLYVADEPTPGMSLTQSMEALRMFREIADDGKAVLLITHDIDSAVEFADRIAVFYAGTTVEIAPAPDFQKGPDALRHPYSKALWQALPQNGFRPIAGSMPDAGNLPNGCLFWPRCPHKTAECQKKAPPVRKVRGGEVRCFYGA